MIETALLLIAAFVVGAIVGWKVNDFFIKATFAYMLEKAGVTDKDLDKFITHWKPHLEDDEGETSKEDILEEIEIKIEKDGNQLYAYRVDNHEFIGQGATKEALIERIGQSLNNVKLVIVEGKEHFSNP